MPRTRTLVATTLLTALAAVAAACGDQTTAGPGVESRAALGSPAARRSSARVPARRAAAPNYVRTPTAAPGGARAAAAAGAVIRVYQDERPWFDLNRAETTILSLGKQLGTDYFVHPLADLASGIPAGTAVVVITSNSFGDPAQVAAQAAPAAQAALTAFLRGNGVLVADLGDNLPDGGFIVPGSVGTPAYLLPEPCGDATLTAPAVGHPIVTGPDRVAGTDDDLTDENIDQAPGFCFVAHGNLEQGLRLPPDATPLMTAVFDGTARTILAEYCHDGGRVVAETNTKEWLGQQPEGDGPGILMRNLFSYALSPGARCIVSVRVDVKPGNPTNPVNPRSRGLLRVALLTDAGFDARTAVVGTIVLGDGVGTDTPVATRGNGRRHASYADVDGDGDHDLVMHFSTRALAASGDLVPGTRTLTLRGQTAAGLFIRGTDAVRTVPR